MLRESDSLKKNLPAKLPLKSKLSGKFQRFNAFDGGIEMLTNPWTSKILIKMNNLRIPQKIFYQSQIAICLKEIIQ